MPKKKQPRNAFFFFMLEYKAQCERKGEKFQNGLADVQKVAGKEWDNMLPEAKKKYEIMAREEKNRAKGDLSLKETSCNNTFEYVERKKKEREKEKLEMNKFVESTVMSLSNKRLLAEYKFYVIHVNYFCISEGECYHPAELAMAEFNLAEGVTNVYHTIIDPGEIPLGFRYDAIVKSDSTHKIPVENNGGEKNFYQILMDIKKFIQPGTTALRGEYPALFTMPDNVNLNTSTKAVKSVIENLCIGDSDEINNIEKYRIYPLEKLFVELYKYCCKLAGEDAEAITSLTTALIELEKDVFNFTQHISCQFHVMEDVVEFCSKSYVQRWVFLICDHCCQYLNIDLIPGRHLPETADVGYNKRRAAKKLEEEKTIKQKDFTWNAPDSSTRKVKPWVPIEEPPLPRPTRQANPALMPHAAPPKVDLTANLPLGRRVVHIGRGWGRGGDNAPPPLSASDSDDLNNFPSLDSSNPIGRGRTAGWGRGRGSSGSSTPLSFASATKNN